MAQRGDEEEQEGGMAVAVRVHNRRKTKGVRVQIEPTFHHC